LKDLKISTGYTYNSLRIEKSWKLNDFHSPSPLSCKHLFQAANPRFD
jgi:hypothetical protein